MRRPPRVAEWLLARSLPGDDREAVLGDLCEEFAQRAERDGPAAAEPLVQASGAPLRLHQPRGVARLNRVRRGHLSFLAAPCRICAMPCGRSSRLRPSPSSCVLTLALGIGANTRSSAWPTPCCCGRCPTAARSPRQFRLASAVRCEHGERLAAHVPALAAARAGFDGFAATSGGTFMMVLDRCRRACRRASRAPPTSSK